MTSDHPSWLTVQPGQLPLVVSMPHIGTTLPPEIEDRIVSSWLARKDTDWWIERLYAFAANLGATVICTAISRTAIDVNREPSGRSLYPGQATTELCPTTTFDGEPLYRPGQEFGPEEIEERRRLWFDPYHTALDIEVARLKQAHGAVVIYDGRSIRSVIPRLFEGILPVFNIGTNGGVTCAPALEAGIADLCAASGQSHVVNGRFRGGYITRRLSNPKFGVHAIQMELACRGYMTETLGPVSQSSWPTAFDEDYAAPVRKTLEEVLRHCLQFARTAGRHL